MHKYIVNRSEKGKCGFFAEIDQRSFLDFVLIYFCTLRLYCATSSYIYAFCTSNLVCLCFGIFVRHSLVLYYFRYTGR